MKITAFDRFTLSLAPQWTMRRLQARAAAEVFARNFDAASTGRRTSGWNRGRGDANSVIGVAGAALREHSRDLLRNNSYAINAQRAVVNGTVGWGAVPKPAGKDVGENAAAAEIWKRWADSTDCDADGLTNFAGLQQLVIRSVFSDGEVLIRRRFRRLTDGLALPIQLQVLEADFLDTAKTLETGREQGPIINGVEFDAIGRRVAFWLFERHPGGVITSFSPESKRVDAREVLHVFDPKRAGQARGVSWLGSAIVNMKDLDEYEDAELVKQKVAACFAGFVTDTTGESVSLGEPGTDTKTDHEIETFEPGMITYLPEGKQVTIANPPSVTDSSFTTRILRKVAAGIGVTYEDMTGDYSTVNFSSARMGRIAFKGTVRSWQNTMLLPQFFGPVWSWVMATAVLAGIVREAIPADWTFHPLESIEPEKDTRATTMKIRAGLLTPSEAIREEGGDPDTHFAELAKDFAMLKKLGLKLDSDPSETSQAGLTQERVGGGGGGFGKGKPTEEPPADSDT